MVGAVRHQAIACTIVDPDLCHHIALIVHSDQYRIYATENWDFIGLDEGLTPIQHKSSSKLMMSIINKKQLLISSSTVSTIIQIY